MKVANQVDILKPAILIFAAVITMASQGGQDDAEQPEQDPIVATQVDQRSQTARVKAIKQIDQWRVQASNRIRENSARLDDLEYAAAHPVVADTGPAIDATELLEILERTAPRIDPIEKLISETTPFNGPVDFDPQPNFSPIESATPWVTTKIEYGPEVVVETKTLTEPVMRVENRRAARQPMLNQDRGPVLNPGRPRLLGRRARQRRGTNAAANLNCRPDGT